MAKEMIVHFEGRDMPMTEWLELTRLLDKAEPAPPVVRLEDGRWVTRDLNDPVLDEFAAGKESKQHRH